MEKHWRTSERAPRIRHVLRVGACIFLTPTAVLYPIKSVTVFSLICFFYLHPGVTNTSNLLRMHQTVFDRSVPGIGSKTMLQVVFIRNQRQPARSDPFFRAIGHDSVSWIFGTANAKRNIADSASCCFSMMPACGLSFGRISGHYKQTAVQFFRNIRRSERCPCTFQRSTCTWSQCFEQILDSREHHCGFRASKQQAYLEHCTFHVVEGRALGGHPWAASQSRHYQSFER